MYQLATKEEIGRYLTKCIEEKFESHRKFCRAYLEKQEGQTDNESIRRMSNRLSQILKGNKEIQLRDLPTFCYLLEVSCDDILSAGTYHVPVFQRRTNYLMSFSKKESEWKEFIEREDSPILNVDEFGKTIIDYALAAENYEFLKYLMDKKYIWFVAERDDWHVDFVHFGAGTSIDKKIIPYPQNMNVLGIVMNVRDELRTQMIALAIRHKDRDILESLHAREIPSLYGTKAYNNTSQDYYKKYYDPQMMDSLICADRKILDYFSEEYEIEDPYGWKGRFIFPFLGEVIERLLENRSDVAESMLKEAIRHNQYVYDQLDSLLAQSVSFYEEYYLPEVLEELKDSLVKSIKMDFWFFNDGNLMKFVPRIPGSKIFGSNVIRVRAQSKDARLDRLIRELNDLFDAIQHMSPKFGGEG